jgi:hypothetical protein
MPQLTDMYDHIHYNKVQYFLVAAIMELGRHVTTKCEWTLKHIFVFNIIYTNQLPQLL